MNRARPPTAIAIAIGFATLGACVASVSCTAEQKKSEASGGSAQAAASAAPVVPGGGQSFGKPLDAATPFVVLADLLKDPALMRSYDGKKIRTRGEVVAVCQAAGCWADLRPEGDKSATVAVPTHVTMHDHAFLLPKTAKTKLADIEGTLSTRTLSQEECDHYNGEGASLVAGAPVLQLDAQGVVLR